MPTVILCYIFLCIDGRTDDGHPLGLLFSIAFIRVLFFFASIYTVSRSYNTSHTIYIYSHFFPFPFFPSSSSCHLSSFPFPCPFRLEIFPDGSSARVHGNRKQRNDRLSTLNSDGRGMTIDIGISSVSLCILYPVILYSRPCSRPWQCVRV